MSRRVFWVLALIVLLSGSLSAALGAAPPAAPLSPTVGPLADPAYLPLVAKSDAPPATALPSATATATSTVPPATATATATQVPGHPLTVDLTERLQWYEAAPGNSYDLVIVADYSYSMRFCWHTTHLCLGGSRRIDYAAGALRDFVHEMLVVRNQQSGGDNRLAYVTFGQTATKVIPFENDTNVMLANFKNAIGDKNNPITLPNSALDGNTNTAAGLVNGISYLDGARTVDKYGKPVRLAVLLLTDGIANVFSDGPATNVTNRWTNAPYYCGDDARDTENPLVQATCPRQEDYPGQVISLPPIQAMVKAADDARAARSIQFYAVVLGEQFGLTPVSMHLNRITDNYSMAYSPAQLTSTVHSIAIQAYQACQGLWGGTSLAAGASVTLTTQTGGPVGTFTADAQGRLLVPDLPPGDYVLSAAHLDVIAPQDPARLPRDYTRILSSDGGSTPVGSLAFAMPAAPHALPGIKLIIDNEANAQCP